MLGIIWNEWRFFMRTKLFAGITIAFGATLVTAVVLGNLELKSQTAQFEQASEKMRAQWESIESMNPHSAAHYGTYVFKPAGVLGGLDEGVSAVMGNTLRVEGHVQNEMAYSETSQMMTASRFGKLKSSLLLQLIIPLLLLFLSVSSVSGEKESGRLPLLIIQGTNPVQLLFGKTIAIWLYGAALLGLVVIAQLAIQGTDLNFDTFQRLLLFLISYLLYYFIICGLTVFISARLMSATAALTSMLAIWLLWTIFLPGIFMSAVEALHPLPSRNEFKAAMKEDRSKGLDGHNPENERNKEVEQAVLQEYGVDSVSQLPINFDGLLMQADEEYGNLVWDKHFGQIRQILTQQKRSVQLSGLLNPFIALRNQSMGLAGNDNLHYQNYILQVEQYRREFIKMLNDEHAFGGSTSGDWSWEADNDFFRSVPDFEYHPLALAQVRSHYYIDFGIALLWVTCTVVLLFTASTKMKLT